MDASSDGTATADGGGDSNDAPVTVDAAPIADGPDAPGDVREAPVEVPDAPFADAPVVADSAPDLTDASPVVDAGGMDAALRTETSMCGAGRVRVHVRDIWSPGVTPTLNILAGPPAGVLLAENEEFNVYGARLDSAVDNAGAPCTYYSGCIPNTITKVYLQPMQPPGCAHVSRSMAVDISAVNRSGEFWIEHTGTSAALAADYAQTPMVPAGPGRFQVTADSSKVVAPACKMGTAPPKAMPSESIRVHFRWPWTDPIKTGYPGGACGDDGLGYSPPPYPTSLAMTGLTCGGLQAFLEVQDGSCTWYSGLIPKAYVPINADPTLSFEYANFRVGLRATVTLPTFSKPAPEYWIAFAGTNVAGDASTATVCSALSFSNAYTVSTQNPGPAYAGCGGP